MTGRTHDIIAFAGILTAASINPPQSLNLFTTIGCLVGGVIGALIPDMDQATNRLWDLLPAGNFVGRILRHVMLGHRTLSHSLLGFYLIYKFLQFVLPHVLNSDYININLVLTSILIGMATHLAADALTRDGIPLFFPFNIKIGFPPFKKMRFTTGKFMENIVIFPAVIFYICWLVINKKEVFVNLLALIRS